MKNTKSRITFGTVSGILVFVCGSAFGEKPAEKAPVTFGGFVDTYYAYDFNDAVTNRQFTYASAARHNEFAVNLAFVEAKLDQEKVRGRLALQAGTAVNANYSYEVTNTGADGLGDVVRHIQEAVVGVKVADNLWIDAGIYFSHIGFESFISRDNWNYLRSMTAENTPYYQTGVKATYQFTPEFTGQLHVLNGWQNVTDNNKDKALGLQLAYATPKLAITYNNFFGREVEALTSTHGARFFNQIVMRYSVTDSWQLALSQDLGMQARASGAATSWWYTTTLLSKFQIAPTFALGGRVEYYSDKDQVIVTSSSPNGFQTWGASVNVDWQVHPSAVWRNEVRGLFSKDAVFTGKAGNTSGNGVAVSSLAVTF